MTQIQTNAYALDGGWKVVDPDEPAARSTVGLYKNDDLRCTAILVSSQNPNEIKLITASHCANENNFNAVKVGLLQPQPTTYVDFSIHQHPAYYLSNLYDLAVITIRNRSLPEGVRPAVLREVDADPASWSDTSLHGAGLGLHAKMIRTEKGILRKFHATVTESLGENLFLTGHSVNHSAQVRTFDSGGPLFLWKDGEMRLVGMLVGVHRQNNNIFYAVNVLAPVLMRFLEAHRIEINSNPERK